MFLRRNVASQVFTIPGSLRLISDGSAVTSSASITISKDGTESAGAGTLTHISGGAWKYTPTQSETDCEILGYVLTATSAVTICGSVRTTNGNPNDGTRLGLTALPNANAEASGGLPTIGTGSGQIQLTSGVVTANATQISGDTTAADNLELFFDGTGYNASTSTVGTTTTVTNAVTANVTQISGDTTAADNLELFFDGTGYNASNSTVGTVTAITNSVTVGAYASGFTPWGFLRNATYSGFTFPMFNSTTGALQSGLTVTSTRSIDGAAFASTANAVTEISGGFYAINLAAADLNGTNEVTFLFTASGASPTTYKVPLQGK